MDSGIVKKSTKSEEVKIMSNIDNRIKNMLPSISIENTTQDELTKREFGDTKNKLYMVNEDELNSFRNMEI